MTYIETKKTEARKNLFSRMKGDRLTTTQAENFLDTLIDELLNDIESRVVPEEKRFCYEPEVISGDALVARWGFNDCRAKILKAFQHLRTGEDITS